MTRYVLVKSVMQIRCFDKLKLAHCCYLDDLGETKTERDAAEEPLFEVRQRLSPQAPLCEQGEWNIKKS